MTKHAKFVCCIAAAIAILVAGFINPEELQAKDAVTGKTSGYPNYVYLAIISLTVGCLVCLFYK